jgi:hypothetical protein
VKAAPCRIIDPLSGKTVATVKGRAYQSNPVKFLRELEKRTAPRCAGMRVMDTISIEMLERLSDLHRLADGMSRADR